MRRQDPNAEDGPVLNESERVGLAEMIEAYTINGAWLMHHEHITGSLEPGKRADITVLDRDLFQVPVGEISEVNIVRTILEGETVYAAAGEGQ